MQNTASFPADRFDELLRRLPADLDLDALAQQTKAIERKREIDTGANLLRLALARGPGGLSLSQTITLTTALIWRASSRHSLTLRSLSPSARLRQVLVSF